MNTGKEWVVLRHADYEEIMRNYMTFPDRHPLGPIIWHIEPLLRYQTKPPLNHKWLLHKKCNNSDDAHEYIETETRRLIESGRTVTNSNGLGRRFEILRRDNYTCQICGRTQGDGVKLEIDHKIPRSKGGSDSQDNLWVLCFDCNRGKLAKDL